MKHAATALTLTLLAACAQGPIPWTTMAEVRRACATQSHTQVHFRGRVLRVLGLRRTRSGVHEGFVMIASACEPQPRACPAVRLTVEDNADITGVIPLRSGDAVEIDGQYECDDAVIHWTHHDPRGRHPAGFVLVNGQRYQ